MDGIGEATTHQQTEVAQDRAKVSQYFDHQTPAQTAAWKRVKTAAAAFGAAHKEAQELYAFQYNSQHGFDGADSVDPVKEAAVYAELDNRLNEAY